MAFEVNIKMPLGLLWTSENKSLYFDLSASLKVKCDGGIRFPIYDPIVR